MLYIIYHDILYNMYHYIYTNIYILYIYHFPPHLVISLPFVYQLVRVVNFLKQIQTRWCEW